MKEGYGFFLADSLIPGSGDSLVSDFINLRRIGYEDDMVFGRDVGEKHINPEGVYIPYFHNGASKEKAGNTVLGHEIAGSLKEFIYGSGIKFRALVFVDKTAAGADA